jgi:hypothetical protein
VRSINSGEKALLQIYGGKQCFFETVFHSSFFYRTIFPDFADLELFFLDFVLCGVSKQWMHSAAFCQFTYNLNRKKAVEWPKIVKSSVSKKSSNTKNLRETVLRKSTGNRQKAVEFVSIERTLILYEYTV